jgi:hypothetical protein
VLDGQTKKLLTFQIDSVVSGDFTIRELDDKLQNFNASLSLLTSDNENKIFHKGFYQMNVSGERFILAKGDEIIDAYYEYPVEDPVLKFNLGVHSTLSISPDNKKMVIGTMFGAILEGFDLSSGKICSMWTNYYKEPFLSESAEMLDYDKSGSGFGDVYATKECIYTLYGENSDSARKDIAIFDWNGTPLHLIKIGSNLMRLCVDEQNNMLYTVTLTDGVFNLARLQLN